MINPNPGLATHDACLRDTYTLNQQISYESCGEEMSLELQDIVYDDRPGPEDLLYCKQLKAFLRGAFNRLPRLQKKAIYLFYRKDLNQAQIAKELEISRSAVSQALTGAMSRLRSEVSEQGLVAPA